jgi:hypothetical protein
MSNKKVEVKIISLQAATSLGAGNKIIPLNLAQEYERRGWAKIVNEFPSANPAPTEKDFKEVVSDDDLNYMPEEGSLTTGCWIGEDEVFEKKFLKAGKNFGFKVSQMSPVNFEVGQVLLYGFVVFSSNVSEFTKKQLTEIKATLFQKRVPFIFRVDYLPTPEYDRWIRQSFILTLFSSFKNDHSMNEAIGRYGELIQEDWFLESDSTPEEFWKLTSVQLEKHAKLQRERR